MHEIKFSGMQITMFISFVLYLILVQNNVLKYKQIKFC